MNLKVLYEDNHLLVVEKKPGILSQGSDLDLPDMLTILKAYIKEKYHKPGNVYLGLVHRLDLNVGGLMVFARTSKAAKRLSQQIRERAFNKKYFAVVKGLIENNGKMNVLENYLKKDKSKKMAMITENKNNDYAKLVYQVLDNKELGEDYYTLVDIDLETGRFHQIRAQFAHIGHPLFGDNKYGEKTRGYELGLYAYQLEFEHPVTKELLCFINYPHEGVFLNFDLFRSINNAK
jgi:23S rRNA pseudouridine1911/1915/1917 synthase